MPEQVLKIQPDRTVHLRGFDHLGASAAVHSASATGCTVSGSFQDAADFAVLVLYDADNFFDHPHSKFLPDFDFRGLVLAFDLTTQGLMPLGCRKYPTIDWPFLDVETSTGGTARIRLSDCATPIGDPDLPASARVDIQGDNLDGWDSVSLWYQNFAFTYTVPGKLRTEYPFYAGNPSTMHQISVDGRLYYYIEQDGDTSAIVAAALAAQVATDPAVTASIGSLPHTVLIERRLDTGDPVTVSASGQFTEQLWQVKATTVARALAAQINGAGGGSSAPFTLAAEASGTSILLRTVEGGYDANFLRLYVTSKNSRLTASPEVIAFSGGSSATSFRLSLDFQALGIPDIRRMWMTFAPSLTFESEYAETEWQAVFSNWALTGPAGRLYHRYAAAGSLTISSLDARCAYSAGWNLETGFFHGNSARVAVAQGASVTIPYYCAAAHDLWLGTSLYGDRGVFQVELDGVPLAPLSLSLAVDEAVVTRRPIASAVAPGDHTLRLTSATPAHAYFDYLQAVVPGGLPDPLPAQSFFTPALDYSTDHTYKLPPARILWNLERLGAMGPIDQYIGVFWWNRRVRRDGLLPSATLTFSGTFKQGDQAFLSVGGQTCGKSVVAGETADGIARHFAFILNSTYVGVRATAAGPILTIYSRSAAPAYSYSLDARVERSSGSTATVAVAGSLSGGSMGTWEIDPAASAALSAGARAWHADFYRLAAARGRAVTTAVSMELVNPPASFAARFPDGAAVVTDIGFAGLHSTHCAFRSEVLDFQKRVFAELASLQAGAGLVPDLQLGEFTWWYFSNFTPVHTSGGMAYYDDETAAAAFAALSRPLHVFQGPDDDPAPYQADALFLRNRLRDHAAAIVAHVRQSYPFARLEALYPEDVNHATVAGVHNLGGKLNHFVNLPIEWLSKATSGFDRFRIEALDYGAWSRDLALATESLRFPIDQGWPAGSVRAMIPVFRGGYPWFREVAYARQLGMDSVSLWAFDHVCLYDLTLSPRGLRWGGRFG